MTFTSYSKNKPSLVRKIKFYWSGFWNKNVLGTYICLSVCMIFTISDVYSPGLPDGVISNQKIPILVNFGGSCNGSCWSILRPFGLFYGHLVYFTAIWYVCWLFGIFFPVLVCCMKKNLATPLQSTRESLNPCNKIIWMQKKLISSVRPNKWGREKSRKCFSPSPRTKNSELVVISRCRNVVSRAGTNPTTSVFTTTTPAV
jgi:hypothetical protein